MPSPEIWATHEGPAVERLQALLAAARLYDPARGDRPGTFGSATDASLRAFQRMHDLPPTGITDPATWQKLEAPHDHDLARTDRSGYERE